MLLHLRVNYVEDGLPQFQAALPTKELVDVRPVQRFDFRVSSETGLCKNSGPVLESTHRAQSHQITSHSVSDKSS